LTDRALKLGDKALNVLGEGVGRVALGEEEGGKGKGKRGREASAEDEAAAARRRARF